MAITYNAGTDTITVTAGTAGVPNTFTDVYNADVGGGWGQVTKTGNMFVLSAKLQVGDGSTATHLYDTFKKITLNEIWTVKSGATLKTGIQDGGHPRKGCFLILNTTAATAINVESGGIFYRYQTPAEDRGAGVNDIVGDTEDFYRGVQIVDLLGGYKLNFFGIGIAEDKTKNRVLESILPYAGILLAYRYNVVTNSWQSFVNVEAGIGHSLQMTNPATLIIDNIVDGEAYTRLYGGIDVTHRFDIPAGGGGGTAARQIYVPLSTKGVQIR